VTQTAIFRLTATYVHPGLTTGITSNGNFLTSATSGCGRRKRWMPHDTGGFVPDGPKFSSARGLYRPGPRLG
jgi:hypothetical protein